MNKNSNLIWGVFLIIIGIIIGLNSLGLAKLNLFFDGWWTLFIIVPSLIDIICKRNITSSLTGIIIGVALLLCCQDIITFDLIVKLSLPIALILIGVSLLFKNKKFPKFNIDDAKIYFAAFGTQKININEERFNGANVNSIFGNINLDISKSKLEKESVIYVTSVFGSINLILPDDIDIEIQVLPIFGGVSNKKDNLIKDNKKKIYIKGLCMFGGVEIK